MKSFYLAFVALLFLPAVVLSEATEDDNLRETLENLCIANREGAFGSCCNDEKNGTTATITVLPVCFGNMITSGTSPNLYVYKLNFNSKGLTTIPSGAFAKLTMLGSLGLRGNSINTLVDGTFEGLKDLSHLDFSVNPISSIEAGAFRGLSTLPFMDLNNFPSLTKLVSGTFDGLRDMETLSIDGKSVMDIEPGTFAGLSNLGFLRVEAVTVSKLNGGFFAGLNSLASLFMYTIPSLEIEAGAFAGLTKMYSLVIEKSPGLKINSGAFEGPRNLYSLGLKYNSLITLPENIFGASTAFPSYLDLKYNNLIYLPERLSSAKTSYPYYTYLNSNCLDCNQLPFSSSYCSSQTDSYCPTDTNKCPSVYKFQKDHCFKCNASSDNAFCDICMPGYKHSASGCGCVKCEEGEACEFGKVRDFDSPCTQCTFASYSSASKCSSCNKGARYVDNDCVACEKNACCPGGSSSRYITNCSQCSDDLSSCLSCEVGTKYVYDKYDDYATCKQCEDNECCLGKNINDTCVQCTDDMTGCKTCHAKKYPVNGVCVYGNYGECWPEGADPTNKIEHCVSCREEDKGCALCEKGYRNQDGVCVEKGKYVSSGIMNGVNVVLMSIVVIISLIGMF